MHAPWPAELGRARGEGTEEAPWSRGRTLQAVADMVLSAATIVLIGVVDEWKGANLDVSLIYVFPLAWATWRVSRAAGAAAAVLGAATDTVADVGLGRYAGAPLEILWNLSVQLTLLLFAAWAVDRIRRSLSREAYLHASLRDLHGRLEQEVRRVADVQRSLLPDAVPRIPGYAVAVHYAMSVAAGGDYYDFLAPGEAGRVGFLVADATGHGPAAAVIMAMARVVVHAAGDVRATAARLLEATNAALRESVAPPNFLTACYALLEPATGDVEFALAGHPLPIVARAGEATAVATGMPDGPPLGVNPDSAYRTQRVRLAPGDLLVLYTDGLTEAQDREGRLFGDEAVLRCVAASTALPAEAVIARLVAEVQRHLAGKPPDDDMTILVVRRTGAEPSPSPDAPAPGR